MASTDYQQNIVEVDDSPIGKEADRSTKLLEQRITYIDLRIIDANSDKLSGWNIPTEQEPFQILKPGNTYVIEISLADSPGQYNHQNSILLSEEVQFRLICSTFQVDHQFSINKTGKKIDFAVPHNSPTCDVTFTLYYRKGTEQAGKIATSLKIKLLGNYNLDDPHLINIAQIDTSLAKRTAVLHIAADTNKLKMTGWSRRGKILQADAVDWEVTKLAEFIRQQVDPEDVLSTIRGVSRTKAGKLIEWIRQLLEEHGEHFCLIIADHTDFETPWEMLELDDDEYLGVKVVVVRWMKVNTFKGPRILKLLDAEKQGQVLFYLDEEVLGAKQTYLERDILNKLRVQPCKDLAEVKKQLKLLKTSNNIGLVYLGCHGFEGESIGSQRHIFNRLTYLNLEMIKEASEPRPVVFVNACESARLKRVGDYFRGLPEAFLARIASGYIGTVGQVESTYASTVAKSILQAACTEPDGICIAEVLRELREEVVNEWLECDPDDLSEADRISKETKLLYTFMYVYYGDAQLRLRLENVAS
jgi:hypothetical protein